MTTNCPGPNNDGTDWTVVCSVVCWWDMAFAGSNTGVNKDSVDCVVDPVCAVG